MELSMRERLFSEERMYQQVQKRAEERNYEQTCRALPMMKKLHDGQTRDGESGIPYIIHPLMMACHALALGVADDSLLPVILLHDVCEDCGVQVEELPFSESVKEAIDLLTFCVGEQETKEEAKERYFKKISQNPQAAVVKVIDRCNNISTMANGFSKERMVKYIKETEEYIFPLLDFVKVQYQEYYDAAFLLKYHMLSVLESLKRMF